MRLQISVDEHLKTTNGLDHGKVFLPFYKLFGPGSATTRNSGSVYLFPSASPLQRRALNFYQMARVSLAATEDPPELRRRLESLQQDFDAFRQDAEATERDLEGELRYAREQLEEVNIDNEELRAQLQMLDVGVPIHLLYPSLLIFRKGARNRTRKSNTCKSNWRPSSGRRPN